MHKIKNDSWTQIFYILSTSFRTLPNGFKDENTYLIHPIFNYFLL